MGPWNYPDPLWITLSWTLLLDLRSLSNIERTYIAFGKHTFQHFCKMTKCVQWIGGYHLGTNVCCACGLILCFHMNHDWNVWCRANSYLKQNTSLGICSPAGSIWWKSGLFSEYKNHKALFVLSQYTIVVPTVFLDFVWFHMTCHDFPFSYTHILCLYIHILTHKDIYIHMVWRAAVP